jgi:uncharacterized membrane protein YphA (DoxX/SURF4 family)
MNTERLRALAPLVLRIGIGFVFLYFGWSAVAEPQMWTGFVPAWTNAIGSPEMLVRLHGIFELVGGLLLITGLWTGVVSGLLFLNLLHTVFLLSSPQIVVRDLGILAALLSLFLANIPFFKRKSS